MSLDERLLLLARTRGHSAAAERWARRFSMLGEHAAIWLVLGGAFTACSSGERRARWREATTAVGATYALNTALKLIVRRERPRLTRLPALTSTPTRFSFPSAHSSTSFAAALAYARAGLPRAPLYLLSSAMACSRLYLGVHYPSDVLAGALLGTGVAALGTDAATHGADLATHGADLATHGADLATHGADLATHGADTATHGADTATHGTDAPPFAEPGVVP